MKITDDEREAAYELKWLVDSILFERERASLYRQVYMETLKAVARMDAADMSAKRAIAQMEKAFEPVCDACKEEAENAASQAKAN